MENINEKPRLFIGEYPLLTSFRFGLKYCGAGSDWTGHSNSCLELSELVREAFIFSLKSQLSYQKGAIINGCPMENLVWDYREDLRNSENVLERTMGEHMKYGPQEISKQISQLDFEELKLAKLKGLSKIGPLSEENMGYLQEFIEEESRKFHESYGERIGSSNIYSYQEYEKLRAKHE